MKKHGGISSGFNEASGGSKLPATPFVAYLKNHFDEETAAEVVKALGRMGLPAPQQAEEFLPGTEGCLLFLNPYGLVIRIERMEFEEQPWKPDRINSSGLIINPVASIKTGNAMLEICPGCHPEKDYSSISSLYEKLWHEDIDFWDRQCISNSGRLPVKTPCFPQGVTVVIDRLAVRQLSRSVKPLNAALKQAAEEARAAQKELYGPLKKSFQAAWLEPGKMPAFWALCRQYLAEGKLVAGWAEAKEEATLYGGVAKPYRARLAAEKYNERLKPDF